MREDQSRLTNQRASLLPLGGMALAVAVVVVFFGLWSGAPQRSRAVRPSFPVRLETQAPEAQPAAVAPRAARAPFSLEFVPRDAIAVAAIRPAALLEQPALSVLRAQLAELPGAPRWFGLPAERFEQVTAVYLIRSNSWTSEIRIGGKVVGREGSGVQPDVAGLILRLRDAMDVDAVVKGIQTQSEPREYAGRTYLAGKEKDDWSCFHIDDRTLVASDKEEYIRRLIIAGTTGASKTKWADAWKKTADADAALLVNSAAVGDYLNQELIEELKSDPIGNAKMTRLAPLWQATTTWALSAKCREELTFELRLSSTGEGKMQSIQDAAFALLSTVQGMLTFGRLESSEESGPDGALLLSLFDSVDGLFDSVRIHSAGRDVIVSAAIRTAEPVETIARYWPAVIEAREEAERVARREAASSDAGEATPPQVYVPNRLLSPKR